MPKTKTSIGQYKDRMSAPVGIVRTNPKTRKPIAAKTAVKRSKAK